MLPLPNLDNQQFADIFNDSVRMIPRIAPSWTDINYHDPGVTFIELFAWLKEMQQYYMNQITDQNRLKFLELLGVEPYHAFPAKLNAMVINKTDISFLPKGYKFWFNDLCFENEEAVFLNQRKIQAVILINDYEIKDITHIYSDSAAVFQPFGRIGTKEGQIYLGIDQALDMDESVPVYFYIENKDNRITACEAKEFESLGEIIWEYYGEEKGKLGWHSLNVDEDETFSLLQSGNIKFRPTGKMVKDTILNMANKNHYWIRGTLKENYYEVMPKVRSIYFNSISLIQKDSACEYIEIPNGDVTDSVLVLNHFLAGFGNIKVYQQIDNGLWEDVTDAFIETIIFEGNQTSLRLKEEALIACKKNPQSHLRVLCYQEDFNDGIIGKSLGTPNQEIKLRDKNIFYDHFKLQIGIRKENNRVVWEDWEKVKSLDKSKAHERHYLLNEEEGIIIFGDNENGLIPPKDAEIRVIAYSTSLGSRGNVKEVYLHNRNAFDPVEVYSNEIIESGRNKESLQSAIIRFKKELSDINRAVTSQDYEKIALETPGLKLARVKALPLYKPGLNGYPIEKAKNCVTLVAVPYSERKMPTLNERYIKNIRRYIEQFRLITTDVHVMSPEYIGINVYGEIEVKPYYRDAKDKIYTTLNEYLNPVDMGEGKKQWEFGNTVYRADLYGQIDRLEFVKEIKALTITASGGEYFKNQNGDIEIPPYGLVYLKSVHIDITNNEY
ncbi:baseplate J/gp47 family protein [Defluviitalea saccharophila]|uniref:Baseplate J/gp47 family protein n=1 Tax=Defluviitalea saccharophila TaxID=879970 RepID=A0ABZ2Y938_9FIRM